MWLNNFGPDFRIPVHLLALFLKRRRQCVNIWTGILILLLTLYHNNTTNELKTEKKQQQTDMK